MRQVDYIIVGCGLAGISFAEKLRANSQSFMVFDNSSQQSSLAAAGLYNPVILKRFTPVWKVKEQLKIALPLYANIEKDLSIKIDYRLRILRRFSSVEEQNLWFTASDKSTLEDFMGLNIVKNTNPLIDAPFGFGEVLQAGRLDTEELIRRYKAFLIKEQWLVSERFDYQNLQILEDQFVYGDLVSKYIVFAEGFGVKQNPFFNDIPLNGTKGEVLTVRIPQLKIDYAVKSSVFIIPLGNDLYTVGSTYNWSDTSNLPTNEAKQELLTKLKSFITSDVEVVNHVAGIRPTVKDRRPLVGRHPKFHNMYMLNGLGTRGVLIGPYVAEQLINHIEFGESLDEEININRFL
ncbi:FAD-dependent oxidoreductase [Winogradskyella sp. DF17]|uniref:FAD-dependent oxidoreductase n=1 Tax=Winogradskyella pelagia TaxID=2819984 RepID=A0ABS3SZJ9_9FLAO|nr:FAD-dependent oxidoreductase [Winogradskyella sp. DF17]MBO3115904.1 FAD-dependent oxidoreductase [Winogradskyella sp. DF17]